LDAIKSLANLHRRQFGVNSAIEVLRKYTEDGGCTPQTRGALVAEWARVLWHSKHDSEGARKLFEDTQKQFVNVQPFWSSWLSFEIEQSTNDSDEATAHKRIKAVHQQICSKSSCSSEWVRALSSQYARYLQERGGKDAMAELLQLDAEMNGSANVQLMADL
jgi:pre-mRNA-processing factor 39